jgi:hypothetical protein
LEKSDEIYANNGKEQKVRAGKGREKTGYKMKTISRGVFS